MISDNLLLNCTTNANNFITNKVVLLLAHGAGAPMDSPFMERIALRLSEKKIGVIRFEFPYMQERRYNGKKRPPNKLDILLNHFHEVLIRIDALIAEDKPVIFIGGKSMGGRVASMLLAHYKDQYDGVNAVYRRIAGCICLGFPFHPVGKSDKTEQRIAHFSALKKPVLILQGERDALGNRQLIDEYDRFAESKIRICFLKDGNHDFKPRKRSGIKQEDNEKEVIEAISEFIAKPYA